MRNRFASLLIPILLLSASAFAADKPADIKFDQHTAPTILEITATIPGTGQLLAPSGMYKELADAAVKRIKRDNPEINIISRVHVTNDEKTKARLLLVSTKLEPMVLTFLSNCSVNSRFNATALPDTLMVESDFPSPGTVVNDHWLSDVCATWTLLRHDWTNPDAAIPKTFTATIPYGKTIDVTYASDEVHDYEQAIADIKRNTPLSAILVANK